MCTATTRQAPPEQPVSNMASRRASGLAGVGAHRGRGLPRIRRLLNHDHMPRTWPEDWDALRNGLNCVKCAEGRPSEDQWSVRFYSGQWADASLYRQPPQPGTSVVVFRGARHVADPCDFTEEELAGYWGDVRTVAKAIERAYQPCQLNYGIFGNATPHVHIHIVPRYPDDPAPGRPLPDEVFANAPTLTPEQLREQIAELHRHL
jgi:diadenosine tetraphosphate (Ap4A) HIT family hydrolase